MPRPTLAAFFLYYTDFIISLCLYSTSSLSSSLFLLIDTAMGALMQNGGRKSRGGSAERLFSLFYYYDLPSLDATRYAASRSTSTIIIRPILKIIYYAPAILLIITPRSRSCYCRQFNESLTNTRCVYRKGAHACCPPLLKLEPTHAESDAKLSAELVCHPLDVHVAGEMTASYFNSKLLADAARTYLQCKFLITFNSHFISFSLIVCVKSITAECFDDFCGQDSVCRKIRGGRTVCVCNSNGVSIKTPLHPCSKHITG